MPRTSLVVCCRGKAVPVAPTHPMRICSPLPATQPDCCRATGCGRLGSASGAEREPSAAVARLARTRLLAASQRYARHCGRRCVPCVATALRAARSIELPRPALPAHQSTPSTYQPTVAHRLNTPVGVQRHTPPDFVGTPQASRALPPVLIAVWALQDSAGFGHSPCMLCPHRRRL
jgi:hypothetical protein